jgi:hypothetical protein
MKLLSVVLSLATYWHTLTYCTSNEAIFSEWATVNYVFIYEQFYVWVAILLTHGKHLHDNIISLIGRFRPMKLV